MTNKPYSEAASRNAAPILEVLKAEFDVTTSVLEIGSGTGQHAVYLAPRLPHLTWQPSDRKQNLAGIEQWVEEQDSKNIERPLLLDVMEQPLLKSTFDGVYSANTAHIMSVGAVKKMISLVAAILPTFGKFALYGPFTAGGQFDSESNAAFDASLRQQDPAMGIRSLEFLDELAAEAGLQRVSTYAMPANNQLLIWQKASK